MTIELGAKANPPGFDEQLIGLEAGAREDVHGHYPADYPIAELAGHDGRVHRDGEGASSSGWCRRWTTSSRRTSAIRLARGAARRGCAQDLEHEAQHEAEREVRGDLLKQLAERVPFAVPDALVEREIDRRLEEFARRLIEQQIDPRQAGIDWNAFRDGQREPATRR